ncbi:MAG: hypothetical protein AB7P69_28770 [Candidatus Binatia bacterium]
MSEISGVQWARVWAKAWKTENASFKELLERDPLAAARQFEAECNVNAKLGWDPFPNPTLTPLSNMDDIDEYGLPPGISFHEMPPASLDAVVNGANPITWEKSKWLCPEQLIEALKEGSLKIH